MASGSLIDLASSVVDYARKAGADQCDVIAHRYDESSVTVRFGEVEKFLEAGSRALGLRVINGGRTSVCSTTDFNDAALRQFVADAVALAAISEPDECAGLPDPALFATGRADALQLYDERLQSLTFEDRVAMAKACEAAALAEDRRITNTDGASLTARAGEVALVNSLGFAGGYPSTSISLVVEVMADDEDGKKRNAHWFTSERLLHRLLPPEEVGRIAARRAIAQLGARKVETRRVPVVFEPMMAASLAGTVAGCANGGALYRGATFLADRRGLAIGSSLFTLTDDPAQPGRAGSRPFDGEGVATRRTVLFGEGVFEGFLFDCYTGRRTANPTTGSASRGIESLPTPSTSNLVVQPGETDPTAIVAGVRDGLYVTTLMGFGFNPATSDFSRGAAGFWIRDGELAYPVTEVNISGRMDAMLAAIDATGTDLTWFGSTAAPTLRIAEMTVSGT